MVFYETHLQIILDPPNVKEDCVIKEDESDISNQTEIIMSCVDVKKVPDNQTMTQET